MKALVLEKPGKLALRDVPVPRARPGNVLIRTGASTICTSDIHDISSNPFHISLPMVIGHEGAGTIVELGSGVAGFKPGDRVAAHPVMPCSQCDSCLRGFHHLCDRMEHLGITREGTFAEYFEIRADRIRLIPETMSFPFASLMEPVCVSLEAIEQAEVLPGGNVLVIGDGPFGVMITKLVRARKPRRVVFVGRHDFRLAQSEHVERINERRSTDPLADIMHATEQQGIDSAILAVASRSAVDLSMAALRSRGTLSVFSGISEHVPIDFWKLHTKELRIHGSCNDADALDDALGLMQDPALGLESIITHKYRLNEWKQAFKTATDGKGSALKVSICF